MDESDIRAIADLTGKANKAFFKCITGMDFADFGHLYRHTQGLNQTTNMEEFIRESRKIVIKATREIEDPLDAYVLGWLHATLATSAALAAKYPRTELLAAVADRKLLIATLYKVAGEDYGVRTNRRNK